MRLYQSIGRHSALRFRSDRPATCLRRCQMASTGSLTPLHGYSDTPSIHVPPRRCPTNPKMGKMPAGDVPHDHSSAIGGGQAADASETSGSSAPVRSGYPIFSLFDFFFQSEQYFSLVTIQPEQYFSASFSQNYVSRMALKPTSST